VSRGGGQAERAEQRGTDRPPRQRIAMHRWSPIDDNKPEGWLGDAFTWLARLRAASGKRRFERQL